MPLVDSLWRNLGRAAGALPPQVWGLRGGAEPADLLVHGASAGEVKAARALVAQLAQRRPDLRPTLSTGTAAGLVSGASLRLPRDVPRALTLLLDAVQPRALWTVEAELWPNLLRLCAQRGVPFAVAGARMGEATGRRLAHAPASARLWLRSVWAFAAACAGDAERLVNAGADPSAVRVCGWLKWPTGPAPKPREPPPGVGPLFVLASPWPGEVRALRACLEGGPLDPRWSRWVAVARKRRHGPDLAREARLTVDSRFGVQRSWLAAADAAYVGGGLRGRGLHDLLDPLAFGLRPLHFARAADPAGKGAALSALDLALPLEPGRTAGALAEAALQRAPDGLARARALHDGRDAALDFLASRGALP